MPRSFKNRANFDYLISLIFFGAVPNLNVAIGASRKDTVFFESYPTHGICVDDFGLERAW